MRKGSEVAASVSLSGNSREHLQKKILQVKEEVNDPNQVSISLATACAALDSMVGRSEARWWTLSFKAVGSTWELIAEYSKMHNSVGKGKKSWFNEDLLRKLVKKSSEPGN